MKEGKKRRESADDLPVRQEKKARAHDFPVVQRVTVTAAEQFSVLYRI